MRWMREWPTKCQRCGDPLAVSSMSFFNEDVCCMPCLDDEKDAPTYAAAKAAEAQAVRGGNLNFNAGLTPADVALQRARRAARKQDRKALDRAATDLGRAVLGLKARP